jgi:tetratricopeptide (TPR) repeat protein
VAEAAEAPAETEKAAETRREVEAAYEGLKARNHFEVLGIPRTASEADVKDAYFRLAKRFHPDVHHGSSLSDLHDQLEAVFIRLGEAYEELRDRSRRAAYEERIGRTRATPTPAGGTPVAVPGAGAVGVEHDAEEVSRIAEEAIRRAAKLFETAEQRQKGEGIPRTEGSTSEYWDAIQLLEPVLAKAQGKLRTKGEVLLARCYLRNPKWARRAEETLLAVTRRDAGAADAWALLGGIYAEKNMHNRALSMYRRALELRPDHEEAARYLATHRHSEDPGPRPAEGGAGLLRRLFRRS